MTIALWPWHTTIVYFTFLNFMTSHPSTSHFFEFMSPEILILKLDPYPTTRTYLLILPQTLSCDLGPTHWTRQGFLCRDFATCKTERFFPLFFWTLKRRNSFTLNRWSRSLLDQWPWLRHNFANREFVQSYPLTTPSHELAKWHLTATHLAEWMVLIKSILLGLWRAHPPMYLWVKINELYISRWILGSTVLVPSLFAKAEGVKALTPSLLL
jgi:hypothetical protein